MLRHGTLHQGKRQTGSASVGRLVYTSLSPDRLKPRCGLSLPRQGVSGGPVSHYEHPTRREEHHFSSPEQGFYGAKRLRNYLGSPPAAGGSCYPLTRAAPGMPEEFTQDAIACSSLTQDSVLGQRVIGDIFRLSSQVTQMVYNDTPRPADIVVAGRPGLLPVCCRL